MKLIDAIPSTLSIPAETRTVPEDTNPTRHPFVIWDNYNPTPGEHVTSESTTIDNEHLGLWTTTFVYAEATNKWADNPSMVGVEHPRQRSTADAIFTCAGGVEDLIKVRDAINQAIKELS